MRSTSPVWLKWKAIRREGVEGEGGASRCDGRGRCCGGPPGSRGIS